MFWRFLKRSSTTNNVRYEHRTPLVEKKFLNFDIESVICYHGGLCNIQVKKQFQEL